MSDTHLPVARTWLCRGCGADWPCPTKRRQLLAEYDAAPISLHLYMGSWLVPAAGDLPALPAGELYERFMGWLPRT